jgi:cytochrome c oxidase subunit I
MPDEACIAPAPLGVVTPDTALRRELTAWTGLAVGALGIAGLFALLLALSRVPGIEALVPWPLAFFGKGLVIHVVFSFVVWFLAVFGALASLASERLAPRRPLPGLGLAAVSAGVLALPLLFVPALLDRGEPTLNNYVPVIIDPLYYAGLGLLAGSIGCAAVRLLSSARPASLRRDGIAAAIASAALVYLLALVCFGLGLRASAGAPLSHDFNETLMWGGGHLLQFVNTLLLVAAWGLLAAPFVGRLPARALAFSVGLLLLGALPAPAFFLFPPFAPERTQVSTWLQYVLGPAAAIMAIALAGRIRRPWPWHDPTFLALALSVMLFAVGGALGLFVDGADTRTPAHYHGVIAGISLAFFGLFFGRFLPLLGRPIADRGRRRLILHLFAWGQLAACVGLFVAGGHGAPRKVAGDAQGLVDLVPMIGMGLNGLGGLVAVSGGILFVWTVASALLRVTDADNSPAQKACGDRRRTG